MRSFLSACCVCFCLLTAAQNSPADSVALSSMAWYNEMVTEVGYDFKEKHKTRLLEKTKTFQICAADYMTRFALKHKIFLDSPDTLIMRKVPGNYDHKKNKEEKEIILIEKAMDDPETSLEIYNELIRLYMHSFLRIRQYEDTLGLNSESYMFFKLHCYHILQKSFPQNASFHFMIGRWHYNYAVYIINNIDPDINEDLIAGVQLEAKKEIQLALPWMKRAGELHENFMPVYLKVKQEFGL